MKTSKGIRPTHPSSSMVKYWLMKSELDVYPYSQLVADGKTHWDGVRNYQACNFMQEIEIGDRGFFYRSLKEKAIVGIVEICKEAHHDSTTDDHRWKCVDIKATCPVKTPVTLEHVTAHPELQDMVLANNTRLSVQPVKEKEWNIIGNLAGAKA